ncbi:MAG: hypothetical protein HY661_03395 [Betaproteobacteria bacterium]|nr:hypothetical protein [Betaproteobacteria bacterium]
MQIQKHLKLAAIVGLSTLMLSGCSGYYMVRDPSTGKTYLSRDVDDVGEAGAVRFKDDVTESEVTLPASEVTEISPREYRGKLKGR